ncbi:MAG: V-type ATP synthase subunit D [gamma proteobacterium symbiont of Taylorina sp.]|nr:V-type ATP synthase subunit D [gamma proteobacterium symbiont of Taylorina sp.]
MKTLLKVPPTKSTLLALKKQIILLEEGYELLERKREILTRLVYERLTFYRQLRKQTNTSLIESYRWLGITQMRMGSQNLRQIALRLKPALKIKILPRSNMGIEYPAIQITKLPLEPVGLLASDASLDEARSRLIDTVSLCAQLGEAEVSLLRMLEEQRKTQKRVNALKYNIIPRHKDTIRFIETALEEEERNTLFQMKVLHANKL